MTNFFGGNIFFTKKTLCIFSLLLLQYACKDFNIERGKQHFQVADKWKHQNLRWLHIFYWMYELYITGSKEFFKRLKVYYCFCCDHCHCICRKLLNKGGTVLTVEFCKWRHIFVDICNNCAFTFKNLPERFSGNSSLISEDVGKVLWENRTSNCTDEEDRWTQEEA